MNQYAIDGDIDVTTIINYIAVKNGRIVWGNLPKHITWLPKHAYYFYSREYVSVLFWSQVNRGIDQESRRYHSYLCKRLPSDRIYGEIKCCKCEKICASGYYWPDIKYQICSICSETINYIWWHEQMRARYIIDNMRIIEYPTNIIFFERLTIPIHRFIAYWIYNMSSAAHICLCGNIIHVTKNGRKLNSCMNCYTSYNYIAAVLFERVWIAKWTIYREVWPNNRDILVYIFKIFIAI